MCLATVRACLTCKRLPSAACAYSCLYDFHAHAQCPLSPLSYVWHPRTHPAFSQHPPSTRPPSQNAPLVPFTTIQSDVVRVKVGSPGVSRPQEVLRVQGIGDKAHGLVAWHSQLLFLDSENGALALLDPATGDVTELWRAPVEERLFLKGLAVVDDVAYFGGSVWAGRSVRDDPATNNELLAIDLVTEKLLWRRQVMVEGGV